MSKVEFSIDTFDKNKNYSIAASAGTGKTFNMVGIVKKLYEENVPIEKILIVTYTEKAAGELKDRIKEALPQIDISAAHIGTIHSFCQETMKEFYITMGLPSNLTVVDDSKIKELYEGFIRTKVYTEGFLYQASDDRDLPKVASQLYLDKDYDLDPRIMNISSNGFFHQDFCSKVVTYKGKSDTEILYFLRNCYDIYERNLDPEIESYYEDIQNAFRYLDKLKERKRIELEIEVSDKNRKTFVEKIEKYIVQIDLLYVNLVLNIKEKGLFDFDVKKLATISKEENLKVIFDIKKGAYKDDIARYFDIACELYILWQQEKKSHHWCSFNDMLRETREAILSNDHLVDLLREKYDYALIDEFQDTNQEQWDIFDKVFLESDSNHIIVVGDNKQSIYSFQGADLTVYQKAVDKIISLGGIDCVLPKNFRSEGSMVEAYNTLFSLKDFESLDYSPVEVGKDKLKTYYCGKETKGFGVVAKKDETGVYVTVDSYQYAKKIVEMISDFCSEDPSHPGRTKLTIRDEKENKKTGEITKIDDNVTFKNFMILARTRSEFMHVEYELSQAGIPFVKYKDDKLFKGVECAQWITLFNAILAPDFTGSNRNLFRQVLFTKFFKKSLKEISSPEYDKDDSSEMELLLKWRKMEKEKEYDLLISSILSDSKLDEKLGTLTDIQSLNIFKQIADYSIDYLLKGNSLFQLKTSLTNLSEGIDDDDDSDGSTVEKGTDFDCVELMTMHASKGLDREIVFVVGGEKGENNHTSPVGIFHDDDGQAYLTLNRDLYKYEKKEEVDRLFYVAYTRARNLLVVPYYQTARKPLVKCIDSIGTMIKDYSDVIQIYDTNEVIYKNKKELKEAVKTIIGTIDIEQEEAAKASQLMKLKKIKGTLHLHNFYKHSYATMSKIKEEDLSYDDELKNKDTLEAEEILSGIDLNCLPVNLEYSDIPYFEIPNKFPKGAEVGTTLHEIYELFPFEDIDKENNLEDIVIERFKANRIRLSDIHKDYVMNMVKNVLKGNLPTIHGSQIDTSNLFRLEEVETKDRKAEAEFNFSYGVDLSNYLNGFIDLLFKRGDYYSILDWKSDTINDKDLLSYNKLEDLKKRCDGHYSIQRVLYSYCLVHWLYDLGVEASLEEVFNKHFGGIYYVFIRGCRENTSNGIYAQTWDSWATLEAEFNDIMKKVISGKLKGGIKNEE